MRDRIRTLYLVGMCLFVAGCATTGPHSEGPAPAKRPWPGLIVLESDESAAYHAVTRELVRQWKGPVKVDRLNPYLEVDNALIAKVQASPRTLVAAIGLPAAEHARRLWGKEVVFCQVFNYESADLLTPWMKGVSAVPPVAEQFRLWKTLDPRLQRVAVITGPALGMLMREAHAAASQNGITLTHVQVTTDAAARYAFERLDAGTQGLWLLPDNRILSREVLRDIIAQAQRRNMRVLVFNPQLLSLGGLLSVESDYADIAAQTVERLRAAAGDPEFPGPSIAPLTQVSARVNAQVAARLGLTVPPQLEKAVYDSDTH